MASLIHFFAYDKFMIPENLEAEGIPFKAYFSVTLSAYHVVYNKIPDDPDALEGLGLPNIEPTNSNLGMMSGVLYEVDDKYLDQLDALYKHPDEYRRHKMRFTKHDFTLVNAVVYIAGKEKTKKGLKPTKAMLKSLRPARKHVQMLYFARMMNARTLD